MILRGVVEPGSGQGASFMSLDWVRRAVSETVGFDPWPGTLNVRLIDDEVLPRWREIRRDHALPLPLPADQSCGGRLVPVVVSGDIEAAVIIPDLTRYGAHVLEVIAPTNLRSRLWLRDRDVVTLQWNREARRGAEARAAATLRLVTPSLERLPAYAAALATGWSPDNVREAEAAREELQKIADDPAAFVAQLDDPHATGGPIRLPDGSTVPRLPGFRRWMWDGEFCGSIGFRWQPGTSELPPHVLGHIGYAVVPWKRGRGYAKAALELLLPQAREQGLRFVELTTDPDNVASQAVILANGGTLIERFRTSAAYGSHEALRFRITL